MSGYIGTQPIPQSTQTRETFTATASQTSFATGGYQAGYIDVFLNGVKLVDGTDFTATNGSDVVLTTGAASGDTLEVVAYTAFEVLNQNFTGGVTVDNDAATVLTVDRATSDGTIIDVQKGGTSVGSIGSNAGYLHIGSPVDTDAFIGMGGGQVYPATSAGDYRDNAIDLGGTTRRFKDLYLSGGVYLGGTGAANKLDDYETGTWTPDIRRADGTVSASFSYDKATYVKIGRLVTIKVYVYNLTAGASDGSQYWRINGVPFLGAQYSSTFLGYNSTTPNSCYIGDAFGNIIFTTNNIIYGGSLAGTFMLNMTYETDS